MSRAPSGAVPVPVPAYLAHLVHGGLAELNEYYPAWRITAFTRSDGRFGGWWAFRHAPLTDAQRAAGLVGCIGRGDLLTLVSEITVQDDFAVLAGYATPGEVL